MNVRTASVGRLLARSLACLTVSSLVWLGGPFARTVSNLNDSGPGSLRYAIQYGGFGSTIDFAVTGTIVLTSGELVLSGNTTIRGPGAGDLTISGNDSSRVFIAWGWNVVISGVTIADGRADDFGGAGIMNFGSMTLREVVIRDNVGSSGGGVRNDGWLIVERSTVRDNMATSSFGGGIGNFFGGMLEIRDSTISGNRTDDGPGGGISNWNYATLIVRNSTITNNRASALGGGIHSADSSIAVMGNTIVAGNTSNTLAFGDCFATEDSPWWSDGHNLLGSTVCPWQGVGDLVTEDAQLSFLDDHGGPTETHALLSQSMAIDAGSCPEGSTDQRGVARPYDLLHRPDADNGCDIGAFEIGGAATLDAVTDTRMQGTNCAHHPCETGSLLDPACDVCVALVCLGRPFCCGNTWDLECVFQVSECAGGCF